MVKRPALWLGGLALVLGVLPGCQCSLCNKCGCWNKPTARGYGTAHSGSSGASMAAAQGWNTHAQPASTGVPVSTPVVTGPSTSGSTSSVADSTSRPATSPSLAPPPAAPAVPAVSTATVPPSMPADALVMPERRLMDNGSPSGSPSGSPRPVLVPATHVAPAAPELPPIDLDARPQIDPPTPKEEPQAFKGLAPARQVEAVRSAPPLRTYPPLEAPPPTTKVLTAPAEATDPDAVPLPSTPRLQPLPPPSEGEE